MFCKQCGAELADNARFCTACGQTLIHDETVVEPVAENTVPTTPPQYAEVPPPPPYTETPPPPPPAPYPPYQPPQPLSPLDSNHFGWAVLGFFYPLVGLILYCIWHRDRPQCAKRLGLGALISAAVYVIGVFFWVMFVIGIMGGLMSEVGDVLEYEYYARMLLSFIG